MSDTRLASTGLMPPETASGRKSGLVTSLRILDSANAGSVMKWRVDSDALPALFGLSHQDTPRELLPPTEIVKDGPMRTVSRLVTASGEFFIKQFRTTNRRTLGRNLLRGSQAEWEASRIRLLEARGVPTARLIAVGHTSRWSFIGESILIVEGLTETLTFDQTLMSTLVTCDSEGASQPSALTRRRLVEQLGEVVAKMHDAGVIHGDLHGGNILVRRETSGWKIWLIDLTKARACWRRVSERQVADELFRLHFTTKLYVTPRETQRFFRSYWRTRQRLSGGTLRLWKGRRALAQADLCRSCAGYSQKMLDGLDRRWLRGNHHQVILETPNVSCRGMTWLGRDLIQSWCDDPAAYFLIQRRSPVATIQIAANSNCSARDYGDDIDKEACLTIETERGSMSVVVTPIHSRRLAATESTSCPKAVVREFHSAGHGCGSARAGWENGHALFRRGLPCGLPVFYRERKGDAPATSPGQETDWLITERRAGERSLGEVLRLRSRQFKRGASIKNRFLPEGSSKTLPAVLLELGRRIAVLLQHLHRYRLVHQTCSVESFGAAADGSLFVNTATVTWSRFQGVSVRQLELLVAMSAASAEETHTAVRRCLSQLVGSVLAEYQPSPTDWLRWLFLYLGPDRCHDWKRWWRELTSAPEVQQQLWVHTTRTNEIDPSEHDIALPPPITIMTVHEPFATTSPLPMACDAKDLVPCA